MRELKAMERNPFIGAWVLESCEACGSDGRVSYPWGQGARGYLLYSADGCMSVTAMSAERLAQAGGDGKAASPGVFVSYCGRYEVREDRVVHSIEVAVNPAWVGTSQVRYFKHQGDRLFLTTPPAREGEVETVAYLIWRRVDGTASQGAQE
jgi:hypothetical protein